jgi:hypothetical protein
MIKRLMFDLNVQVIQGWSDWRNSRASRSLDK